MLDRYRLEEVLGSGGFGTVWRARDERLERDVAVKVVPREREDSGAGRAEREARVVARLNHPGIVALYELGGDEHSVYLVSELVAGATLAELYRARAVADRDVARVGIALCDALAHAHEKGVIHRDVKPANVLVVAEPAAGIGFAKLADFGVAHLAGGDPLTRTGDVVGTLAYMAPEQAEGERATEAADVYALALTLYEGFTGSNPVRAASPAATARRLGRRLPALSAKRADLPEDLSDTIDDALSPLPDERPHLWELREELEDAERDLESEGGLVEPGTIDRFGLEHGPALGGRLAAIGARLAAGAAAGGLLALGLTGLGPDPPASVAALAAGAALLVAMFPRGGWIAAATALVCWLALPGAGHAGSALVLAAGLAAVPLMLPRDGLLWSVPALAPLAGALGAAPVYVAVAGIGGSAWLRARLAALGFLWLALAEVLSGSQLLFGRADGTLAPDAWSSSVAGAASDGIWPFLASPAWAPALVWAAFAVVLPFLVRARGLALDLIAAAAWAAALTAAHGALEDLLVASVKPGDARGAAVGALAALLVALGAGALGVLGSRGTERPLTYSEGA